jgi:hypothetical protein
MNRLFIGSPKFIHNGKNLVSFDITLDILKESLNLGYNYIFRPVEYMMSFLVFRVADSPPFDKLRTLPGRGEEWVK